MLKPELLLPVGNLQMCLMAIHNGADAIYVGMPKFNARGRSHDFSFEDLKEMIDLCHLYSVKVNVAFNILIFETELEQAIEEIKKLITLGPDAIIVQDIGLIKLINEICPDQVVHGSTQMTVTNHEAIELVEDLNIKRFVLGRENSLTEIEQIKKNTHRELEVFVHGALCVAYSGQCFTSESLGGRSANRGQCAQSCRFDYELIVDGKKKMLGNLKYLVSPKDLCGIKEIPKLQEIGVHSLKVEGRLKGPEYVASISSNYRQAIDNYKKLDVNQAYRQMESTYSRGYYSGWLHSVAHQELVDGSFSNHRGHLLGSIEAINKKSFIIKSDDKNLSAGDGIVCISKNDQQKFGGKIFNIKSNSSQVEIQMGHDFPMARLSKDFLVYLNHDHNLIKSTEKKLSDKSKQKKIKLHIEVKIITDSPIVVIVSDDKKTMSFTSKFSVQKAISRPSTQEEIQKSLLGFGHTVYEVSHLSFDMKEKCFISNKDLKEFKRQIIEDLNLSRTQFTRLINESYKITKAPSSNVTKNDGKLNILVRNISQLESALEYLSANTEYKKHINYIILDYEFGADFVKSVKFIKDHLLSSAIATTRILKPSEYHNFRLIQRADPDALLIRNLGAFNYFKNTSFKLLGDFSLNAANSVTFDYLISKRLDSLCASYDLNAKELSELVKNTSKKNLEVTVHQYMPEFHMEHCVFAAFLSEGNSFRDCGKPCEKHRVQLKDMYGNMHELKADQECRNTMFNSKVLSAIELIPQLQSLGVELFRLEFLHESHDELIEKLDLHLQYVSGKIKESKIFTGLDKIENYGVTSGQLYKDKNYQSRKKALT